MSGKRVTKPPRKYDENEDPEANSARRMVPYVKVKFVDDGQMEIYDSALLCGEIINPKNDEAIKFSDLYLGQEVAALWKNTNHYLATIIELYKGDQDSTFSTRLATQQSDNVGKVNAKKSKEKRVQKSSKELERKSKKNVKKSTKHEDDSDDGTKENINAEIKRKKKEIQAENKKKKEAIIASNQQTAASLFAKCKNVEPSSNNVPEPCSLNVLKSTSMSNMTVPVRNLEEPCYTQVLVRNNNSNVLGSQDVLTSVGNTSVPCSHPKPTAISNTAVPVSNLEETCHTRVLVPNNNSNLLGSQDVLTSIGNTSVPCSHRKPSVISNLEKPCHTQVLVPNNNSNLLGSQDVLTSISNTSVPCSHPNPSVISNTAVPVSNLEKPCHTRVLVPNNNSNVLSSQDVLTSVGNTSVPCSHPKPTAISNTAVQVSNLEEPCHTGMLVPNNNSNVLGGQDVLTSIGNTSVPCSNPKPTAIINTAVPVSNLEEPCHTHVLVPNNNSNVLGGQDVLTSVSNTSVPCSHHKPTAISNTAVPVSNLKETCHTRTLVPSNNLVEPSSQYVPVSCSHTSVPHDNYVPASVSNISVSSNSNPESFFSSPVCPQPKYPQMSGQHHSGKTIFPLPTSSEEIIDISDNTFKSGFMSSSINVINGDDYLGSSTPRSPTPPPFFESCNISHISDASQNCFDCEIKDKIIKDLKSEINQLKQSASTSNLALHESRKRKYQPKTRPEVEIADYICPNDVIPDAFHLLAPGSSIAVNSLWLHNTLSLISKQRSRKEKKAVKKGKEVRENRDVEILKKLMDGFFYPWDLAVEGGTTKFQTNPVYKGLQLYATHHLKMDIPYFKKCWNAKMVSARQTVKRQSSLATNAIPE